MKIINAERQDKAKVVEILCASFRNEPQTQYIIGEGGDKEKRLERLMSYAFEQSMVNGRVHLDEDKHTVSLWRNHHSKKMTFKLLQENMLFFFEFGFKRLERITKMGKAISQHYPDKGEFDYLWMFGTQPNEQGKGYGSALLKPSLETAKAAQRDVFLETSTQSNLTYYAKKGFQVYSQVKLEGENAVNVFLLKLTH